MTELVYKDFISKYSEEKTFCKTNQSMNKGIAISTFHKLKGLEFDTVFLTNMDNAIFPNFHSIESHNCSEQAKLELKESETRLAYVAITRARNTLYVYYNEDNPILNTILLLHLQTLFAYLDFQIIKVCNCILMA